ncbi:hypothetical protein SAMN04489867_1240 [Pedococcus dokdonensis]|uniref:Uncharacterized protein n=1 Tax=Pedococcus dokdonensis TaxID=443156 RepID=A0A1H0PEQ6_9MICO|nr:hypothetical protein SAMN04489867_1240 [Pedococcus dokdonensis]
MGTRPNLQCTVRGHRWDVVSDDNGLHERCRRCGRRRGPARTDEAEVMIRGMRNGGGGGGVGV